MPAENMGRTATWAKILAGIVLLVLLPLVLWFITSFADDIVIPW
jgi:hypothetical protein